MVKLTCPKKTPSITTNQYVIENYKVEEMPYFLYEVNIYRYDKYGVNILDNRFYKSSNYVKPYNIIKKEKDYILEKNISILGVTRDFICKYNLPLYDKKRKSK